ncbi:DUF3592 domain-containing protein [Kribbella sp. NBC_00482]|uniref:DUF3592 domain-containing protein n=1 Tax=Kribbella sp. NBC_00482 TaxID=2975968 RepID=UPI002E17C8B7
MALVGAVIVFVVGFVQLHTVYVLEHRGEVVTATLLDVKNGKRARITVSYTTREGEPLTAKIRYDTIRERGDTIRVVYDPQKPSRVDVPDGFSYWVPGMVLGLGVVLCVAALVMALWRGGPSNQARPEVSPYPW